MLDSASHLMNPVRLFAAALIISTGPALHGASTYVSTVAFGGGATSGNPAVNLSLSDGPIDLYIYFVPEPGDEPFISISLDIDLSTAGVADLIGFSVVNPNIVIPAAGDFVTGARWNGTGGSLDSRERITGLSGVSVVEEGLDIANDGSGVTLDQGYDPSASAFYFGSVTLNPVGLGNTELRFSVGSIGIARSGDRPQPVGPTASIQFGDPEPTSVSGDSFGSTGSIADAVIRVIPEPSTGVLLGAALLPVLLRRRRRG